MSFIFNKNCRFLPHLVVLGIVSILPGNSFAAGVGETVPSNCNAGDFDYAISNIVPLGVCTAVGDTIPVNFDVSLIGGTERYDLAVGYTQGGQTTIIDVQCLTTGTNINGGGCDDFSSALPSPQIANTTVSVTCDVDANGFVDPLLNVDFYLNWDISAKKPVGAEISGPKCKLETGASGVSIPLEPATLTLQKSLVNDSGGTALATDWTLSAAIGGTTKLSGTSGVTASDLVGGDYVLTESGPSGYTQTGLSCTDGVLSGNVLTLTANDNAVCTFTNNDDVVAVNPTLTLNKTVLNDNSGTASASDFTPSINGTATTWGTAVTLAPGTYTATETSLAGYTAGSWGGDCAADGSITLSLGQNATCTITNDDDPPVATSADLSVSKTLTTTGPYSAGQTVSYTIIVSNAGPDTATNVVVTDLPTNMTINSVSSTNCSAFPCTIPSLANGASETITVQATVP